MTVADSNKNVVDLLLADHKDVENLLARFDSVPLGARDEYFCEVVNELVRHEVAEELVVYPAVRSDAPNGAAQADARITEQSEAEQLLYSMEKLDTKTPEFTDKFTQLRKAVLDHAQAEESQTFPLLSEAQDLSTLQGLGERYQRAKASAPTHPHPHAPDTPPGNRLLGPMAAMVDRARDAMRRA